MSISKRTQLVMFGTLKTNAYKQSSCSQQHHCPSSVPRCWEMRNSTKTKRCQRTPGRLLRREQSSYRPMTSVEDHQNQTLRRHQYQHHQRRCGAVLMNIILVFFILATSSYCLVVDKHDTPAQHQVRLARVRHLDVILLTIRFIHCRYTN